MIFAAENRCGSTRIRCFGGGAHTCMIVFLLFMRVYLCFSPPLILSNDNSNIMFTFILLGLHVI